MSSADLLASSTPRSLLLAEQQRADRQLAVEPAAGLVDRFADEVGGELLVELLCALCADSPTGRTASRRSRTSSRSLRARGACAPPRANGES